MTATNDSAARERIHRTAAELFARNGYHGTGMSELSEAVGLGRGALYYHIVSKESVLYAITAGAIEQLIKPSDLIVQGDGTAEARIRELARVLMRNIAELSNQWTVFFREHSSLTGQWHEDLMHKREHYEGLWWQLLQEGVASGEFGPVPQIVTKGVLGMFNYSYLWLRVDGLSTPEDVADLFCDVLLGGLRATE
ncbi:MAG: TetR family transcriptional regulator [Nocardioides sp.]|jgi:AcrR family transcriptional regulator|nr:TetR family transcriptional regulator [Nocardioides sp.]